MMIMILALILPGNMIAWLIITHYTAKIRRMNNGQQYNGFWADAMWPLESDGSLKVDSLLDFVPIPYFKRYEDESIEKLRITRNIWVFISWGCIVVLMALPTSSAK